MAKLVLACSKMLPKNLLVLHYPKNSKLRNVAALKESRKPNLKAQLNRQNNHFDLIRNTMN